MVAGNVLFAASQWLMLVVVGRLNGPAAVGEYAYVLAIVSPIMLLAQLGLRPVLVSDQKNEYAFEVYVNLRLILAFLGVFAATSIAAVLTGNAYLILLTAAVAVLKGVENISDIYYAAAQRASRLWVMAASLGLRGVGGVSVFALVYCTTRDMLVSVLAMVLAWLVVLVGWDLRGKELEEKQKKNIPFSVYRTLFLTALPMGIVSCLIVLNTSIPRVVLQHAGGAAELGVFAAMVQFMLVGTVVMMAMNQALASRLAKALSAHKHAELLKLMTVGFALASVLGVGFLGISYMAATDIMRFVYGESFTHFSNLLVWVAVAAWVGYVASLLTFAAAMSRQFVRQLVASVVVVLFITGLSVYLIPHYGVWGAVLTLILGGVVHGFSGLALLILAVRKKGHVLATEKAATAPPELF